MSRLQEFKEVMDQMALAWKREEKVALVMLIDVKGSAYRLPGTKMMMSSDGFMFGTISGGCLENDLYGWTEKAWGKNRPLTHKYDLSENDVWSLGIGCKGDLEILIMPMSPKDSFGITLIELLQKDQPFSLIVEVHTGRYLAIEETNHIHGNIENAPFELIEKGKQILKVQTRAELFACNGQTYVMDAVKSSERLIVAGAGRDAVPLVELAKKVGFAVTVFDSRTDAHQHSAFSKVQIIRSVEAISREELFNSWWVIMNHHQEKDEMGLKLAIESKPRYIGVLGPLSRTEKMLKNIRYQLDSGPIHSPVGLNLGAETMDEVAISIVAEMMSIRAGCQPESLHGAAKIHV
ncbi:MAG: XdhC family protein [Bacillus sp. (in: firmicutes)]